MNRLAWIGIILWGLLIAGFGLASAAPAPQAAAEVAAQDVVFLISGGILICLSGVAGLLGWMNWVPELRKQQKNVA